MRSTARRASTSTRARCAQGRCALACTCRPQASARRARAGALLPRRPHLHRRDLRHQGGRAAVRRGARSRAGHVRHEPARARLPGDDADWDFGQGAGFYLDATRERRGRAPIACTATSRASCATLVEAQLPGARRRARHLRSLDGRPRRAEHRARASPREYKSVSAFAPIVAPSQVPWGRRPSRATSGSRPRAAGPRTTPWRCSRRSRFPGTLLVDQGTTRQVPRARAQARAAARQPAKRAASSSTLRMRDGYDHSYYFIASFVDEHLVHHARVLSKG